MKLDMSLIQYIPPYDMDQSLVEYINNNGVSGKIKHIITERAYWEKASQIHNWFLRNVQYNIDDCGEYFVPKRSLQVLVNDCKKVLNNKNSASRLLPIMSGFFYGKIAYNEIYFSQLESTIAQIEPLLLENIDLCYTSSW